MTAERLRARREEICDAVIHRALSVAPPTGKELPGYVEALRRAIPNAVEYAFDAIELGEERVGPIPVSIPAQAAASSRSKVGLEVVMRRYAAGYSTLSDFLHREIRAVAGDTSPAYSVLQRELTALFDRVVVEVSDAYHSEEVKSVPSSTERRLERIRRLMAGDLIDPEGLDYPLEGHHLAVIVSCREADERAGDLGAALGLCLLRGDSDGQRCAIWLGGARPAGVSEISKAARVVLDGGGRLALGQPGAGLIGWRRTMRQAEATQLVARRNRATLVWYSDVALLAAVLRDPDLAHFLEESFVRPLRSSRIPLVETLHEFLRLNGNASSTAAALGISRRTVASRILTAERLLGRPLEDCAAELETALQLAKIEA